MTVTWPLHDRYLTSLDFRLTQLFESSMLPLTLLVLTLDVLFALMLCRNHR